MERPKDSATTKYRTVSTVPEGSSLFEEYSRILLGVMEELSSPTKKLAFLREMIGTGEGYSVCLNIKQTGHTLCAFLIKEATSW
jgi:hypothetical protein